MKTVSDIRAAFLAYFNQHDHTVVPSSSLVPHNDPTLLFTNAGMVQFKNAFTGAETLPYVRAASSQKCVRAGGKHNDLENVGHTARHHTFFEMLGNFSFGDYFKEDAIKLAWDLITKEFGLSAEKLLVTVYADDEEAAGYWKKIAGFPDHKIIRIATSDNFWSMGPTGPCGPCSEIFYDHGESIPGGPPGSPNEDGDRFIEIWNLVFMQYEQIDENTRINLPKPSIDTGMGLERIAAVLQGKHDNYDIDLFKNLIKASTDITGHKGSVSHRVIADHLRSSCFLMADGVMPSNEGRGYVLRRIMRRAMRHVHILGYDDCLMHQLVPALIAEMGQAYSELIRAQAFMTETLKIEEERFKRTLGNGLRLLQEEESKLSPGQNLPGDVAFKLYDTFGFPLDLTQDVLKASNRSVDLMGFDQCMEKQRTDARANWVGSGEKTDDQAWFDLRQQFGATEFLGYDSEEAEGKVLAIVQKGQTVEELSQGKEAQLLINQTPFYAESGGQTGDAGTIKTKEAHLQVRDVKKLLGDLHVHHVTVEKGTLRVGEIVQSKVDHERRLGLRAHHSATHLLHKALRDLLGDQVIQKGSLVGADRLRFDFSFPKAVSKSDLQKIEDEVNRVIRSNAATHTHLMNVTEAIEKGAMALFGEKYADEVRVVSMGSDTDGDVYSVELCGGTHVHRAGDIGYFRIVSESGIAAGIRRIEAFAGKAAEEYVRSREMVLEATAELLKVRPVEVMSRVEALQEERKKLEKEIQKLRQSGGGGSAHQLKEIKGITLAYQILEETSPKDLKPIADALKSKIKSGIIVVIGKMEDKVSLVVCVTGDLISTFNAVDLVRAGSDILGGQGGGGRPDMAQAGGIYPDKAEDVIGKIEEVITAQI